MCRREFWLEKRSAPLDDVAVQLETREAAPEDPVRALEPSGRWLEAARRRLEERGAALETLGGTPGTRGALLEASAGGMESIGAPLERANPLLEAPGYPLEAPGASLEGVPRLPIRISTSENPDYPMKDTIANKIASFVATLNVADKDEFKPIWENQPPLAFTEGIAAVRPLVATLRGKAAKQSADITGSAKQLKQLRIRFETQLHALARAAYQCLVKQGQTATAEKVNLTPTDLHNARGVALAGIGSTVLDAAEPLLSGTPAPAAKYFTLAQVDALDALWQQFSAAVGAPASARSNRKALTGQLPDDVRAVEAQFSICDDFLPQFAATSDEGRQFSDAWFGARQTIDLGRRASKPGGPPSPPTP